MSNEKINRLSISPTFREQLDRVFMKKALVVTDNCDREKSILKDVQENEIVIPEPPRVHESQIITKINDNSLRRSEIANMYTGTKKKECKKSDIDSEVCLPKRDVLLKLSENMCENDLSQHQELLPPGFNIKVQRPMDSLNGMSPLVYNMAENLQTNRKSLQVSQWPVKYDGQLCLFYMIFYALLAALFAICMQGLLATLNTQFPKWQLDSSIIGTSPGVGFRPMPENAEADPVIKYTAANKTDVKQWVSRIDDFLTPYKDQTKLPGGGKNQVICDVDSPPTGGNVCAFDVTKLGPCTSENGYSYNKSAPCMFIKLNRIYGWVPDYYDDVNDLPSDMPADLVEHIKSLPENQRKQVWVSCNGLTATDGESIGLLQYYPSRGFPSYYYPFTNKLGYLSPLVAVHFARPIVKQNINVECRAWAKNVIYRGGHRDRRGSIHIVLRIE